MSSVNLHIERLVIEGLPLGAHEGPLIQAAIEAELGRLLGDNTFARDGLHSWDMPLVRAEPMVAAGGSSDALGAQIGQAIYGGIEK